MRTATKAVLNHFWAITPEYLETIISIAERENLTPEAVEAALGRPLDNTHEVTVRDGIATVPVVGPLFRRADMFTRISGATSIDTLATDLSTAVNDPVIKGVILYIDSPGGEVNGTSEFAQMVYQARGVKPITAYVSDLGCSAAYWIASAADTVIAADTATVGSIGVVAAMRDPKKKGSDSVEFVSSQSPNKRPDIGTEGGKAQIQRQVDDLAAVFVNSVARNRDVTADDVLAHFGQGGVFIGQKAVDAGLADSLGTYEGVLEQMASDPGMGDVHVPGPMGPKRRKAAMNDDFISDAVTPLQGVTVNIDPSHFYTPLSLSGTPATTITTNRITLPPQTPPAAQEPEPMTTPDISAQDDLAARLAAAEERGRLAEEKAAAAAARIAALESENTRKSLATTAAGWHGDTAQHVSFMEELSAEGLAFYVRTMNALSEQAKTSVLFASSGVTGGVEAGSALAELNAHAESIRREKPSLSKAKAFTQAMNDNPALYDRYLSENAA